MMLGEDVHLDDVASIQRPGLAHAASVPAMAPSMLRPSLAYSKSPRHVGAVGKFRYLTPADLQSSTGQAPYDYVVIVHRSVRAVADEGWCWPTSAAERLGFRRLCMVSSPLLEDGEDEHRRLVEKLCAQGLLIDIIDGGHSSSSEMTSEYLLLLVRASDEVASAYAKKFRRKLWLDHGGVSDMPQDFVEVEKPITPAERIEIVQFIIEQRARLSVRDRWIHTMLPVHDAKSTHALLSNFIFSIDLERRNAAFVDGLRHNFGEKVAYYFALMHFYTKALLPIALGGVLMEILRHTLRMTTYMRLLPIWGLVVSVVWSFSFLKAWDRRNAAMQFEWNNKVIVKQIEYPNKAFHGDEVHDSLIGEPVKVYAAWKRYPIHVLGVLFLLCQTLLMLVLVALWVSIYEMIKDKYKASSGFLSKQWCLILLEGIVFGFFVDVVQWNLVVTSMGRLFTTWENYKTEEAYERALITKLFGMDFLNYFTWFFSLAFVYVIPGAGNALTNALNTLLFHDPSNCCFGPDLLSPSVCARCPSGVAPCVPCQGYFTFDIRHVDLSAMFVTPIIVTQLLNIVVGVVMPLLSKLQGERARAAADRAAQDRVRQGGSMKILGALDYDASNAHFSNKDQTRYLEYTATEIEILNQKARNVLFESEQTAYDPYNDFHTLTVQFGFTVMFSMLWPPMPMACLLINLLKVRTDGYRLCRTLKRPHPRKANGIGTWRSIFSAFAYIAVLINVLLVCLSTGAMEFYSPTCVQEYADALAQEGKTLQDFVFGPNFHCVSPTVRLVVILVLEHLFLLFVYVAMRRVPSMLESCEAVLPLTTTSARQDVKPPAFFQSHPGTRSAKGPRRLSKPSTEKAELARQWADTP
ncbi:hypothetical protein SPRG_10465 [Saprolegnia parasitica CBS 223.65]|uniref:Anoctamin transmembrane domain-containing protein n=1 Tax=Saprolegnia parasitica (strain CBS 223.65) TaxID=695850 RepID=A0A067C1I5_SAPPC|nr:hypothetical protein SPRG_10465 [Saprolegnia parasitica CBS 223.65]KDO24388.1 hypothetical protein SPRG_10465 [Saprolegnia parasitica CBS 223.65]|eukprot:XP_012204980.1 hypothetical protein SPRG_10465 [Saprolegnia parasitica CBS 223.65]